MTIITIPKILQENLTEEGARAFVEILDKVEARSETHTLQVAEERFEKKLEQAKSELKTDIANVRVDLIKWMFIFWAGQLVTVTGILIAFLKK